MGAEIFPVKAFLNCSIIPAQFAVARVILTKGNSPEIIKIHLIRTQIAMSGNIGMAVLWCVGGGGMLCWNDWLRRWWEPIYSQAAMTPLSLWSQADLNPSLLPSSAHSSHWSKSRANTLQYKLQTLQQQNRWSSKILTLFLLQVFTNW